MPTELDYARLAAYIDGEGSIFIRDRKPTPRDIAKGNARGYVLTLCINNCDPRLITWCKETFGGGCAYRSRPDSPTVSAKYQRPRRAIFQWIIGTTKAANLIRLCLPYFLLKREQAEIALAFQKTVSRKYSRGGVPLQLREQREFFRNELMRLKHVRYDLPENQKPN